MPFDPRTTANLRAARRGRLLLLILFIAPIFWDLGALELWGGESRWMFIVRHMLQTGDPFATEMDGAFYGDKPFLSYWLMAASAKLCGGWSVFAARLPSAVAAAATVLVTYRFAARLFGSATGTFAACVLASSVGFAQWARTATADLDAAAFTTAAVVLYGELRGRASFGLSACLGAMMALGAQAKGIPSVAIPCGVIAADCAVEALAARRALATRRGLAAAGAAAAVFLALYLLPFVAARVQSGGWRMFELMIRENFVRAVDPFDHKDEGPLFYTYILPGLMAPWSLLLPPAVAAAAVRFRRDGASRFALTAFAVIFCIFTLSASRRSYYILPAMPFAAVLVAAARAEPEPGPGVLVASIRRGIAAGMCALAGVVGALLLLAPSLPGVAAELAPCVPGRVALGIALVAVCVGAYFPPRRSFDGALLALGFVALAYFVSGGDALRSRGLVERRFAEETAARRAGEPLVYFGIGRGGRDRWYFGDGPIAMNAEELKAEAARAEREGRAGALVIAPPAWLPKISKCADLRATTIAVASVPPLPPWESERPLYYLLRCSPR